MSEQNRLSFTKMIIFDYYDGELSGVYAEDEACEVIARFDLLAWDDNQDWRFFCIGRIPNGNVLFKKMVQFYAQFEKEHWPVWSPNAVPENKENEERQFQHTLNSGRRYQWVLLSKEFYKDMVNLNCSYKSSFKQVNCRISMCVRDFCIQVPVKRRRFRVSGQL